MLRYCKNCGLLLPHFYRKLKELGVERVEEINDAMRPIRHTGGSARRQPKHIIILVKEQKGIRKLY